MKVAQFFSHFGRKNSNFWKIINITFGVKIHSIFWWFFFLLIFEFKTRFWRKNSCYFLMIFRPQIFEWFFNFFCLTCHGSSANFALWPPMIRFANWRCLVIPHSGSLCRISLATRFWARPVPTKVSCNKENQISFFVAHRLSSSKQSRVFSRSDVIWIFRLMDTPLLLYTWQRNSLSGS